MVSAFKLHPAYLKQLKDVEEQHIRLSLAKNLRWPQLDLTASFGLNGLGDSVDSSWDDVSDASFEAWSLGVELTVPLGGWGQDKTQLEIAKFRQRQSLLNLKSVEIAIGNALETSIRKVRDSKERIDQYKIVRDSDQRLLDVELSRLEIGKSDSRKVLEIEEDLFDAKNIYIQSINEYQKALLDLEAIEGSVLKIRGIEVAEHEHKIQDQGVEDLIESLSIDEITLRPGSTKIAASSSHVETDSISHPKDIVPRGKHSSKRVHEQERYPLKKLDKLAQKPLNLRLHVVPVATVKGNNTLIQNSSSAESHLIEDDMDDVVPLR